MTRQEPTPDTWTGTKERSNPFTLNLICWLALNTSRTFARMLLYPITLYFLLTAPTARRASKNYFRRLDKKPPSITKVARHIFHFAATILDRVYFITDRLDQFKIDIHGKEVLDRYLDQQQGCLLLGAHFGSFDALRSLAINRSNLQLKIMMYYEHNAMIVRVLDRLNPKLADAIINLADEDAILKMQEVLERGELVGMLGDRASGERSCDCQLLGETVEMPTGPLAIASIVQVPVILFFPLYMGQNRYEIYFEELTGPFSVARGEREQVIAELMQRYASRLEYYINKAPYNWFNFYDFWSDEKK